MPPPVLEIERSLYAKLMADVARSGRGVKEAGAFLLGSIAPDRRKATAYIMYDSVAPESSRKHVYVAFTSQEMARAWEICYASGLQVVADIHSHPQGPQQSISDRAHPIVSLPGHVALIAPFFAMRNPQPADLGVHVFEGAGCWRSMFQAEARNAILLK
jgi:proteasome lid subunit RPN8/RPN11